MLATLIQRYDKESFHFKNERLKEIHRLSDATFYDCIIIRYQFIKRVLDDKMSTYEEYGAFNTRIRTKNMTKYKQPLVSSRKTSKIANNTRTRP